MLSTNAPTTSTLSEYILVLVHIKHRFSAVRSTISIKLLRLRCLYPWWRRSNEITQVPLNVLNPNAKHQTQNLRKEEESTQPKSSSNPFSNLIGLPSAKRRADISCRVKMDSRIGLDYIVENREYISKLGTALDTSNAVVKKQVFELLSALCAYNADGYARAIETLEFYKVSTSTYCTYLFMYIYKKNCVPQSIVNKKKGTTHIAWYAPTYMLILLLLVCQ